MTTKKGKKSNSDVRKSAAGKKMRASSKKTTDQTLSRRANVPVVGIGASAGGLVAFETFFKAMSVDSGAAFVLVSHLDPTHTSILPELIQKKTAMKVNQVVDNTAVVPNQVYIIPPNKELAILNGTLQLLEMSAPRGSNLPIDIFFRSLAQDQGDRAVAIILSGTGTDGTLGIRAIKGEGGMVMAQDMDSAQYDGMPRSAIASGLVDYILAPDKMAVQLCNYLMHLSVNPVVSTNAGEDTLKSALPKICVLLRSATGHDFSRYKTNTISRRIERRMHIHQINNLEEYIRYLRESEHEIFILFKELLIGVTSFFRDAEAFASLKENLLEQLKDKPNDYPLRIWVPGCSTGEEAYSVAVIVQECMESLGRHFSVQIFGTDLDEEAVSRARAGTYPESVAVDIPAKRLREFFNKDDNQYKVKKKIREMVVFAPQDIIKDPPFTKLDLLCCRNLLIYFDQELQKKLLPMFHYSLKPEGILFLGSSESTGQSTDLFRPLDKKWKIFKAHPSSRATYPSLDFPAAGFFAHSPEKLPPEQRNPTMDTDPLKLMKTIISQSDMSTCVVIDDRGNILYIHGRTGCFLEPSEGEANLNILEMARPGLKGPLTSAIRKMAADRLEVVVKGLQVKNNGSRIDINLIVRPLPDMQTGHRGLMMVIFDKCTSHDTPKADKPKKTSRTVKADQLKKLEDELQYTRENLQSTIEELETANEELQSTNEELQSTNEELETSKEELQSLNEESATVNSELQGRIDELVTSNDDMKNLLDATDIATVFLDIDLNIRRFTVKATELIPLTTIDIGRPISHFATSLKDVDLSRHAKEVLRDLGIQETEVTDNAGTIYRMRLRPYRTINNVIDGVVIIFDDITELKQLAQAKRLAVIVKDSNDAIILHDLAGNISAWNRGAEKMYGYSESEALQMNIVETVPRQRQQEVKSLLTRLHNDGGEGMQIVTERLSKDGTVVPVWLTITPITIDIGKPAVIASTERDLSMLNTSAFQELTGKKA